ncbi:MAG: hypothetical protein RLZZ339_2190 [Cyanobacteriota bacterium]|jgi:hypothetical protein
MFVLEFKVEAKLKQYQAIDDAIRTAQFIRNKCLRYWMDNKGVNKYDLSAYCRVLAHDFKFAGQLNSQARQASDVRRCSVEPLKGHGLLFPVSLTTVRSGARMRRRTAQVPAPSRR